MEGDSTLAPTSSAAQEAGMAAETEQPVHEPTAAPEGDVAPDGEAAPKKRKKKKKKKVSVEVPQNEQWDALVGRSGSSSARPGWWAVAQITAAVAASVGLLALVRQMLAGRSGKPKKSGKASSGKPKAAAFKAPRIQARDVFLPTPCILPPTSTDSSSISTTAGDLQPTAPLQGLTMTLAENVSVAGTSSTWGFDVVPFETLPAAATVSPHSSTTAPAVEKLLSAGVRCVAKSRVAFLGHELDATNFIHLGNKQLVGGGAVGAAAAISGGLVDFAVVSDHVGGSRVAAACCGVSGYRCSPGVGGSLGWRMPPTECVAMIARDVTTLRRISQSLDVPGKSNLKGEIQRIYVAEDLFKLCDIELKPALQATKLAIQKWAGDEEVGQFHFSGYLDYHLKPNWRKLVPDKVEPEGLPPVLEGLRRASHLLYAREMKSKFGHLIEGAAESDNEVLQFLAAAAEVSDEKVAIAETVMSDLREMLRESLRPDVVLVLPTLPGPPPLDADPLLARSYFRRAHLFSCIATMAGSPCVGMVPGRTKDGRPLPIGLMSVHRTDARLLAVAEKLEPIIKEQLLLVQDGLLERLAAAAADKKAAEEKRRLEEEKNNEKAETFKEKGNQLFQQGQYDKAIAQYTQALKLNAKNPVYYSNRALVHLKQFSWQEAEQDCSSALEHPANDKVKVKALLRRAMARRALSKFRPALVDLEQALSLEPKNKDALIEREDLLREAQAYQEQLLQQQQQMRGGLMPNGNGPPAAMVGPEDVAFDDMGMDYEPDLDLENMDPGMAQQYDQYLMQQQLAAR